MNNFFVPYLHNPGVLSGRIPENIFNHLKKAVLNKEARNQSLRHDLVGSIKEEYITPRFEAFDEYLFDMFNVWCETYQCEEKPHTLNPIWTNYMKAGEFNPNHCHPKATAVFVIWIQIPYDLEKEMKVNGYNNPNYPSKNSCFEFTYSKYNGEIFNNPIYLDKSHEGNIIMFPGSMIHCVYPFHTSNEERISVAGNFYPKV